MGEQGVELKESPPVVNSHPPSEVEGQDPPAVPVPAAHTARMARIDNMPRVGRRVSSIEAVKGAPPPKRQSVVVYETPDSPPAQ
ncbi:unnamed protein product [Haemonchus placei]|uniref:Uncharacterized protein n=1 Tax=Haemonchus placei TaxID=6290 RepID=A0A0N4WIC2_HAEPC|nr:unnamed protein product [Haemonchus placei]